MRFGIDTLHSDNDIMTRVAQSLNSNLMAHQLKVLMLQGLTTTTEDLNDSIACGQSDGATIPADVLNIIQKFRR